MKRKLRPSDEDDNRPVTGTGSQTAAPEKQPEPESVTPVASGTSKFGVLQQEEKAESDYDRAKQLGYTGDSCPECGSMTMIRNGTCQKCITCGSTTGCS